jgi:hypothetical protein
MQIFVMLKYNQRFTYFSDPLRRKLQRTYAGGIDGE